MTNVADLVTNTKISDCGNRGDGLQLRRCRTQQVGDSWFLHRIRDLSPGLVSIS